MRDAHGGRDDTDGASSQRTVRVPGRTRERWSYPDALHELAMLRTVIDTVADDLAQLARQVSCSTAQLRQLTDDVAWLRDRAPALLTAPPDGRDVPCDEAHDQVCDAIAAVRSVLRAQAGRVEDLRDHATWPTGGRAAAGTAAFRLRQSSRGDALSAFRSLPRTSARPVPAGDAGRPVRPVPREVAPSVHLSTDELADDGRAAA